MCWVGVGWRLHGAWGKWIAVVLREMRWIVYGRKCNTHLLLHIQLLRFLNAVVTATCSFDRDADVSLITETANPGWFAGSMSLSRSLRSSTGIYSPTEAWTGDYEGHVTARKRESLCGATTTRLHTCPKHNTTLLTQIRNQTQPAFLHILSPGSPHQSPILSPLTPAMPKCRPTIPRPARSTRKPQHPAPAP